jgi:hypothetical protein
VGGASESRPDTRTHFGHAGVAGMRVAGGRPSSGDCCAVKGSLEELTPAHLDWLSALPKHGFGAHVLNAKSAREIERETAA